MRIGFYPKLALDGIRKNKRMYLPYILTCIGMVMMNYILLFLQKNPIISDIKGGSYAQDTLSYGVWLIAIFSGIFLFYTNSFLLRRRKKEFGLYNILGMGKKNIGIILIWETIFIAIFSLIVGIFSGVVFSKIAELGLVNVLKGDVTYTISVSLQGVTTTASIYCIIFVLLLFNALRQVAFSSAISLLRSENVGEKPLKANWVFGILGVFILAGAYYMAVTIKDPMTALVWFFVAVLMVIIATYLIMISGSVVFCRILQKNKKFYYKSKHFVSVSSMVYRMKRNGAGLASICILATMVLVMISSTTALYMGEEDMLDSRYPREINTVIQFDNMKDFSSENVSSLRNHIISVAEEFDTTPKNVLAYRSALIAGLVMGDTVELDQSKTSELDFDIYSDVYQFYIIPIEDYNAVMGTNKTLDNDEAFIYMINGEYSKDTISFQRGKSYTVKERLTESFNEGDMGAGLSSIPSMMLVVPDVSVVMEEFLFSTGDWMNFLRWEYYFDTDLSSEKEAEFCAHMSTTLRGLQSDNTGDFYSSSINSREDSRAEFYAVYGGLFYLGLILSIVFMFAAVLIIYYKQISEGYEDQSRFEIMQKVGMTKKEIRKSINSQILTVFFLPLLGAGLHLVFAFPIIEKLLLMFNMRNHLLYVATTIGSFLVFALFYSIVYRITSNAYYNIVSGAKEK